MTDPRHPVEKVPGLVGQLYELVAQLEGLFPGRRFTPDGHLVGSIGEVIAAHRYGLELLPHSAQGHDARSAGRTIRLSLGRFTTEQDIDQAAQLIKSACASAPAFWQ